MDYQRVLDITSRSITKHLISSVMGEYYGNQWEQYHQTQGDRDQHAAKKLNTRDGRILKLTDRRTRGYKYLQKQRKDFDTKYEKNNPPPPSRLNGLQFLTNERWQV